MIGNMVGRFVGMNSEDASGGFRALRFHVAIYIFKPLRRGVMLKLPAEKVKWIHISMPATVLL